MRFWSTPELRMDVVSLRKALDNLKMLGGRFLSAAAAAVVLLGQAAAFPVHADTMEAALLRAYRNNPQLNAQRASVRRRGLTAWPIRSLNSVR